MKIKYGHRKRSPDSHVSHKRPKVVENTWIHDLLLSLGDSQYN